MWDNWTGFHSQFDFVGHLRSDSVDEGSISAFQINELKILEKQVLKEYYIGTLFIIGTLTLGKMAQTYKKLNLIYHNRKSIGNILY